MLQHEEGNSKSIHLLSCIGFSEFLSLMFKELIEEMSKVVHCFPLLPMRNL